MASQSDIHLYTTQTPNGIKISITLEELGLSYEVHKIDISKNTQKEPWFLEINPNGRIPALTDTFTDGKKINLFESGSIQQYLVDRYDTEHKISYPKGTREYYEVNNWLFFLNAGVGPMQGQANHFSKYAPRGSMVGDRCTIADIAHWGWVTAAFYSGVDIEEFPALKAWDERMEKRPGVEKGRHVPDPHNIGALKKDPEREAKMKAAAEKGREWIQAGMKSDAKK
ncbi:Disulfide-bond oxidoreductase YfcG 2 [Botrytis cinerea]